MEMIWGVSGTFFILTLEISPLEYWQVAARMEVDLAKQLFCNSSSLSLASELSTAFDDVLNHHTKRLKKREAPAVSQSVFQVSNSK